jgi:MFS family permease
MPSFAATVWGLAPAAAAAMLAAARILSIPGKLSAGRRADRTGALATAGQIGLLLAALGLCWTLVPVTAAGVLAAVGFAAGVSGLGPLANVLALEAFGGRGVMLGLFRSAQIGLGAVTSALLGGASERFGLRTTLGLAAVLPGLLGLAAWKVRRRIVAEIS